MGNERARRLGTTTQISAPTFDPEKLILITDKDHPMYDPRVELPLDPDLVASIKKFGVKQPVHVLLDGKEKGGHPHVLVADGRQRVKACREANRQLVKEGKKPHLVPAIQTYGDYLDVLMNDTVLLNEQRVGNTALYRAQMARRLHEGGKKKVDIALALKVSTTQVDNLLKLLDCSKKVQNAVEAHVCTLDMAIKHFSTMKRSEQDAALEKMLADGGSLRGRQGRKKLAAATNKPELVDKFMGRKEIRNLLESIRATLKTEDDEILAMCAKLLEHVSGERKRCPLILVKVEPPTKRGPGRPPVAVASDEEEDEDDGPFSDDEEVDDMIEELDEDFDEAAEG